MAGMRRDVNPECATRMATLDHSLELLHAMGVSSWIYHILLRSLPTDEIKGEIVDHDLDLDRT
ncbi:hypothetical protein DL98DRAFT_512317 [Cadophora sp. DSE1049]|nr:hypothetical protein DL98DRAFT_512317 [Cadophora sp. DSE1049]